jgi:hypothetical protein
MIDEQIHVAIKSYKRAGQVTTLSVVPFAWLWVPESQAESYENIYPGRVKAIPDSKDGNLCRKSNAILDASPCPWTLILDDDISSIHYFEGQVDYTMTPDQIMAMVCHGFEMADQLGVSLWGINQNSDEMAYNQFRPFSLLSPILGPFNGHLSPDLRYDESVVGKDDYDFWLQNIRKYHRTFRMNKYHYIHDHGKRSGGFVSMRTKAAEEAGITRMIQKWGPKVFNVGGSAGARRNRSVSPRGNVLNSMIRVPIKGC